MEPLPMEYRFWLSIAILVFGMIGVIAHECWMAMMDWDEHLEVVFMVFIVVPTIAVFSLVGIMSTAVVMGFFGVAIGYVLGWKK